MEVKRRTCHFCGQTPNEVASRCTNPFCDKAGYEFNTNLKLKFFQISNFQIFSFKSQIQNTNLKLTFHFLTFNFQF